MRRPALILVLLAIPIALSLYLFLIFKASELSEPEDLQDSTPKAVAAADPLPVAEEEREDLESLAAGAGESDAETAPIKDSLIASIRVIDASSREAVPFAEVAVLSEVWNWFGMSMTERHRVMRFGEDKVALYAKYGRMEKADAKGELHLPINKSMLLACENEGRFGELYLLAENLDEDSPAELVLQAERSMDIRIVDRVGEPIEGIPIGIRPLWGDSRDMQQEIRFHSAFPRAYTDAVGEARLTHLQTWFARETRVVGEPKEASIRMLIPCLHIDSFVFDPRNPPRRRVEIKAPATGSVLVTLRDTNGEVMAYNDEVFLKRATPITQTEGGNAPFWGGEPQDSGQVIFPFVALGQRLSTDTLGGQFSAITFAGPTRAGQVVEVELRAVSDLPLLRGQLVDEDLQPIGRMHVKIPFQGENFGSDAYMLTTSDEQGRFRYEFSKGMIGEAINLAFVQEQIQNANAPLIAELGTAMEISKDSQDLGRIIMSPAPLLASGRVSMDGAVPAQLPELRVEYLDESEAWRLLPSTVLSWPGPGTFVLSGLAGQSRHRILPSSAHALPQEAVEFRVGQEDLLIETQRGGSLQLDLLLDSPELAADLHCELLPQSLAPESEQAMAGQLEFSSSQPKIIWRGLKSGDYRLEIRAVGMETPLETVDGLQVLAGTSCEDPRLHPLDLRGKLREISIHVQDAGGRAMDVTGNIILGTEDRSFGVWIHSGHAQLLIAGPVDLRVAVQGYEIEELREVDADRSLRLRKLPSLQLDLPAVNLPAGVQLTLFARPQGLPIDDFQPRYVTTPLRLRSYTRPSQVRIELGDARQVQVPLREGEELGLRLWLEQDDQGRDCNALIESRVPAGRARSGAFTLQIDQLALREAIQAGKR